MTTYPQMSRKNNSGSTFTDNTPNYPTWAGNSNFIDGSQDTPGVIQIAYKNTFKGTVFYYPADYVIVDLGAAKNIQDCIIEGFYPDASNGGVQPGTTLYLNCYASNDPTLAPGASGTVLIGQARLGWSGNGSTYTVPNNGVFRLTTPTARNGYRYVLVTIVFTSGGPYQAVNYRYWFGEIKVVTDQTPAAPTGLTGTVGNQQNTLRWTAPTTSDAGSALSGASITYNVKRATTQTGARHQVASGIAATNYVDTGLTNGQPYYYEVTATNANG